MANHVHFHIEFKQINDEAKAKLNELYSRIRSSDQENYNGHQWFSDMFVEGDLTYKDTEQYSWTTANIGPKWCYLEEFDTDSMYGFSAWGAPQEGLEKLLTILAEHDPNIVTLFSYEDESPNFAGACVFDGEHAHDWVEWNFEEIRDYVIEDSEVLNGDCYDVVEDEWDNEESEDTFYEEIWETINMKQHDFFIEMLEEVEINQKDREENPDLYT